LPLPKCSKSICGTADGTADPKIFVKVEIPARKLAKGFAGALDLVVTTFSFTVVLVLFTGQTVVETATTEVKTREEWHVLTVGRHAGTVTVRVE